MAKSKNTETVVEEIAPVEETAGVGHNTGVAPDKLRSFVERIERLEEEKKGIAGDIREVYAEAGGTGFDVKTLRQVIRLRKQDKSEREEQRALLELYLDALGLLD